MTSLNHSGVVRRHLEAPHSQKHPDKWDTVRGQRTRWWVNTKPWLRRSHCKSQKGLAGQRRLRRSPRNLWRPHRQGEFSIHAGRPHMTARVTVHANEAPRGWAVCTAASHAAALSSPSHLLSPEKMLLVNVWWIRPTALFKHMKKTAVWKMEQIFMVLVVAQDGESKASGCENEREVKCFLSF